MADKVPVTAVDMAAAAAVVVVVVDAAAAVGAIVVAGNIAGGTPSDLRLHIQGRIAAVAVAAAASRWSIAGQRVHWEMKRRH